MKKLITILALLIVSSCSPIIVEYRSLKDPSIPSGSIISIDTALTDYGVMKVITYRKK